MTINDRVTYLLKLLGLKQKDFAERLLLKPNTLSMITNHKRNVTDRVIKDICREFKVNEDWLVNGNEPIFNDETERKSYIDELIKQHGLTNKDRIILETYINMDEVNRELFYKFIKAMNLPDLVEEQNSSK